MPRLTVLPLLLVAACAVAPRSVALRDAASPLRSIAGYDFSRMVGDWQTAAFLAPIGTRCGAEALAIRADGAALRVTGRLCTGGGVQPVDTRAVPVGPGRLALSGRAEDWWVIWSDHGDRTLVIAPPSGTSAVVLDRGRISPDRLQAARDVLAFNGFDVARLIAVPAR